MKNNDAFLTHAGKKHGQSVRASLSSGRIIVTEVDKKQSPRFKTEDDKKKYDYHHKLSFKEDVIEVMKRCGKIPKEVWTGM